MSVAKASKASKSRPLERKRLVILDAHAILHRAYHGMPDFSSSKGEPTGALYGLSTILMKIIEELRPDAVVACMDLSGPTHRHTAYDGYKATRRELEDALLVQLKRAHEVFDAFSIPMYSKEGYEADDCIGTIVKNMHQHFKNWDVIIASGDHDTLQLVHDRDVRVFTMRKGINDTVLFDEDGVRERYNFGPEHIADYKGLRGDPSDNIKGIKGVGEKTATELIVNFGSIENMYEVLEKTPEKFLEAGIKPRIIELLKEGKQDALFSKKLSIIDCNVPINFSIPEKAWCASIESEKLNALFDTLEFKSLKSRITSLLKTYGITYENPNELFPEEPKEIEKVDPQELRETEIAVWLLRSDLTNPSLDEIVRYARAESFEPARNFIFKELMETGLLWKVYKDIEQPLITVLQEMHSIGIELDTAYLAKLSQEYHAEVEQLTKKIYEHAGKEFNISSPKQLADILFDTLKLSSGARAKKTATGQRSTKEEELDKLRDQHPVINLILSYREKQKLLGTYIDALPLLVSNDGRLHTTFLQTGSTTGRMASHNPNLQNIPTKTEDGRRVRKAFVAKKGCKLLSLDYSQIELRIAAGLSGDAKLVKAFRDNEDIHAAVASEVFDVVQADVTKEMRRKAKVINFGILYGMGAQALKHNLGDGATLDEARKFLDRYFEKFSGLAAYITESKAKATRLGYTETLYGRRRYISGLDSSMPHVKAAAERMAVNAPIQGTQADIIKLAMVGAKHALKEKGLHNRASLLLQIHDELMFEVEDSSVQEVASVMRSVMTHVVEPGMLGGVPIEVGCSVGPNWAELRDFSVVESP